VYQGAYCEREVTDARALKNLIGTVDSDTKEIELPKSLPSIRRTIDQGGKYMHVDSRDEHIEECKEIDSLVREVREHLDEVNENTLESIAQRAVQAHKEQGERTTVGEVEEIEQPRQVEEVEVSDAQTEAIEALKGVNPREAYMAVSRGRCDSESGASRLEPYYTLMTLAQSLELR